MKFFRLSVSSRVIFTTISFLSCISFAGSRPASAQRLSPSIRPGHYALTLTPDLKDATFSGVETIDLTLAEPSNSITLNSAEIAFQQVAVTAGGKQQTATVSSDQDKEQTTFTFAEPLPAGKAALSIAYTGILNNQLRGFYLSRTAKRNYAVTQFEATDARRAFPSFDEPAFKATFDVSLVIDAGDTAISNGPIVADTPGPGDRKHTLKFLTTPKMSTYLVAFLVGDFQCTAGESDGVQIRSCSTPGKVALTPYSVDVAKYVLHYYNTYFGIPYPLKKLDLIALPDFEAGAMENFGAITYRETALLIDPKTASIAARKTVAVIVAHEMAHQWFGDLVTMQWWDNIWLNEGFATWMESKAIAALHPEWNMDEADASDESDTLNLDAGPTTRAIRAKAETREEIEEMFDGISYGKAGAVLGSVENFLGQETFRQGVHNYLSAHLYANATAEDFWGAQTATSHKPVDKIMESLVAQPGVPLLTFGEPFGGVVSVAQNRFFLSPSIQPDPQQKWTIPVCMKVGREKQDCQILAPDGGSLKTNPSPRLFFANAGGKGYYRAAYPPSVYSSLVGNAEALLSPAERISLIGDEWAQVHANKATVGDYLRLVTALKDDPSAEVVGVAFSGVIAIDQRVAGSAGERAAVSAWVRSTFAPVYAKLAPPSGSDSSNARELRAELFSALGRAQDPAVLAEARRIAENYLADQGSVDATLGQAALSIAARNGDAALFDQLQKVAETSTNPELQSGALQLLAAFEDPALAARSLDYAASSKVRNQDALYQFAYALQEDATRDLAWNYVKTHWDTVKALLTPDSGGALVGVTGSFCSAQARDDAEAFFAAHKLPSSQHALKHAVERINGCIELRSLQEPNLKLWIAAQPKP
ncbi:MAG: M1 family aminopeptidase [Terracidiphilus sp.]|nr:M1 family aminopeptidase [Terracidiphilus sp.]